MIYRSICVPVLVHVLCDIRTRINHFYFHFITASFRFVMDGIVHYYCYYYFYYYHVGVRKSSLLRTRSLVHKNHENTFEIWTQIVLRKIVLQRHEELPDILHYLLTLTKAFKCTCVLCECLNARRNEIIIRNTMDQNIKSTFKQIEISSWIAGNSA